MNLTLLATQIYSDLGCPAGLSPGGIETKLASDPFIGKLNNLISMCYSGVSGNISPALDANEQSIYSLMYQTDYYTTKLNQTLNGTDISWTSLSEGDSRITRVSAVEQAKVYKDMSRQLNDQLQYLITTYRTNPMQPRSVEFVSYVAPSVTYPGS